MVRGPSVRPSCAALIAGLFFVSRAHAAPPPSLDLRGFQASTDPKASLYLEPAATPGHLQWNVGAWASYAYRVVELEDASGGVVKVPVRHQLSLDYVASLGLTDRLALGFVLPTVAYQSGADGVGEYVPGAVALPKAAIGDLAFTAKATLLPRGDLGGFALAALARVSVPTGGSASYVSESASGGELRVLGELGLVALTLRATAGMRVRGAEQTYAGAEFGHDLPWGVGISVMPQAFGWDPAGHVQANIEAHGAVALTPSFGSKVQSPAALGASLRYGFGDVFITLGGEAPLSDAVGVPRVRALLGFAYAPRVVDTDKDGVPDQKDECVELAEDRDGFEDGDGCPDFDNDDDGVPDEQDKCPALKEDIDSFQDEDGCPDLDNDQDGTPDTEDKCPLEPGPRTGKEPGCPQKDRDLDGIPDRSDRCPSGPEDRDTFQDDDGCPDLDNDQDGSPDVEDACPKTAGAERSEAKLNGCPSPDRDGDTFDDARDRCPNEPEDFDGDADADGCPEPSGTTPLARIDQSAHGLTLTLTQPPAFTNDGSLDPKSEFVVRAIAAALNQRPDAVLLAGVRPAAAGADAEQAALNRSFSLIEALRHYTHRDECAETIAWEAVEKVPGATKSGLGFLLLSSPPPSLQPRPPRPPRSREAPRARRLPAPHVGRERDAGRRTTSPHDEQANARAAHLAARQGGHHPRRAGVALARRARAGACAAAARQLSHGALARALGARARRQWGRAVVA
ncbi:MAG: thrombospondin type 3 repeat-containing protein [Polyangiaceae bacterium]